MTTNKDWQTLGHQKVKNVLDAQISSGQLPHAYLFLGPESVGKKTLALEFAKKILNTEKLENHPDFSILDAEGEITVEKILQFISTISFKPFMGAKKVAIINNAHNLNLQSSNALLKTLEEPSKSSVIILVSSIGKILPTIISRCQSLNFGVVSQTEIKDFAKQFKADEQIINLSFGRPGRLWYLSQDKDFLSQELETINEYEDLKKKPLGKRFSALSGLAEKESAQLSQNLLTWLMWQYEQLAKSPKDFLKVQAIQDALEGISKNFNKKLVLQKLLVKI